MPIWKCRDCHHEWEGTRATCDWCFTPAATKLADKSELEQMLRDDKWRKLLNHQLRSGQ